MSNGDSVDNPQVINPNNPHPQLYINGIPLDMYKFTEAVEKFGGWDVDDIVSIRSFRDSKGNLVPDYGSIRLEKKAKDDV